MTLCPNCGRALTERECGDATHRLVRGYGPDTVPAGMRECNAVNHVGRRVLPLAKFFRHGTFRRDCNTCAFKKRVARNQRRRGAAIHTRRETDRYWNQQAAKHA